MKPLYAILIRKILELRRVNHNLRMKLKNIEEKMQEYESQEGLDILSQDIEPCT
jgi:hypothetical protein